jgi:hemolysin activation/secretion protein
MLRTFVQSCVLLVFCAGTAVAEQAIPPPPVPNPLHGGAALSLSPIEPKSPASPEVVAPVPQPSEAARAAEQPLSAAPVFVLRGVTVVGNSVLDGPAIDAISAPYLGRPVSIADLEEIRRQLTLLYIKSGYINSGFTIPDQNIVSGQIVFRAVEGRVTDIDITGADHFDPEYFRARLERGLTTPFNVADLERQQQILLQDPLLQRLNIELLPGLVPGEARARASLLESRPYSLILQIANNQSPTVGEVRGQMLGTAANLLGFGDVLSAQYGRSQGINDGAIAYSLPLTSSDTRLNLRYDINRTVVVTPAVSSLRITSRYNSLAVGLSQPVYRTPEQTLTIGGNLERRDAQSFLLDLPFAFTPGSDNGRTNVTVLRLYQDFLDRDAEHAFALRSTVSVGLPALGATVTSTPPTGRFTAWLLQGQYVRRIYEDWEAVLRSNLQLSNHPLFPIEQFALGGIDTVRGYRQFLTVTDDAFFASGEVRIPVTTWRLPFFADSEQAGTIQIVPFYDFGRGWNVSRPTPYPADISGAGVGLRWLVGSGISAEVYYARPLRHVSAGTSLEERGIYFRLTAKAY